MEQTIHPDKLRGKLYELDRHLDLGNIIEDYFDIDGYWLDKSILNQDAQGISPDELEQLRNALYDVAEHTRKVADSLGQ